MKRFVLGFISAFIVIPSIVVVLLLGAPTLRQMTFRFIGEVPSVVNNFIIRQYILARDYKNISKWLNRELDLHASLGRDNGVLLPGLMKNVEFVVNQSRVKEEYIALQPFLVKLVKINPNILPARLWLGRAYSFDQPDLAFTELLKASEMASADERSYRIAVSTALRHNRPKKLEEWCGKYSTAQFGGNQPYGYHNLFQGVGLRRIALQVDGEDGNRQWIEHLGLQLGEENTYSFSLAGMTDITSLSLHLGVRPGVRFKINKIRTFQSGTSVELGEGAFTVMPWSGFVTSSSDIYTTSFEGESIEIFPSTFKYGIIDRVDFDIQFKRVGLANLAACRTD